MSALETLPPIRLTELTDCGGCAAKLGADLLADALTGLGVGPGVPAAPDELIAGLTPPDDAAAYRVSDDLAIIGTLDFFPPLVDDARTFGEIAAANALGDVFAMGGRVLFALSIAAFPEDLPRDTVGRSPAATRSGTPSRSTDSRSSAPVIRIGCSGKAAPGPATRSCSRNGSAPACSSAATARGRPPRSTSRPPSTRCGRSTGPPPRSWSHTA
jgi:hypothetical protein